MSRRLPALFRHLRRDRSGVSAIEFTLAAPVILTMLLGGWEISLIAFSKQILSMAAAEAARTAKANVHLPAAQRLSAFQTRLDQIVAPLPGTNVASVRTTVSTLATYGGTPDSLINDSVAPTGECNPGDTYREQNGVPGLQTPNSSVLNLGGPGDVVRYDITMPYDIQFGFIKPFFANASQLTLRESVVVRNQVLPGVNPVTVTIGAVISC